MIWLDVQGSAAWHQAAAEARCVIVRLPFPPTVNHAYRATTRTRKRDGKTIATVRKTEHAAAYGEDVWWCVRSQKAHRGIAGPVAMLVCATRPNNLRRDVANLEKILTDSLVDAEVMRDDSQVYDMRLVWAPSAHGRPPFEPGEGGVEVSIRELLPAELAVMPPTVKARSRRLSPA